LTETIRAPQARVGSVPLYSLLPGAANLLMAIHEIE
jgi:hypothetical protein